MTGVRSSGRRGVSGMASLATLDYAVIAAFFEVMVGVGVALGKLVYTSWLRRGVLW